MTTTTQRWAIAMACTAAFTYHHTCAAQSWSLTDIGQATGAALNESGQVVGQMATASGQLHAFATGANGQGAIDLGTLGGSASYAYGINDVGQVVGMATTSSGSQHATQWLSGSSPINDLGTFGGTSASAQNINNLGQTLLNVNNGASGTGVYRYDLATQSSQNITPTRYSGHYLVSVNSTVTAINDQGTIVGSMVDACDCAANAHVFQGAGSFAIGAGVLSSAAFDINEQSQVVGYFHGSLGGVIGDYGFLTNLSTGGTVGESSAIGSLGGTHTFAWGINNLGVVVGESNTAGGQTHAFITGTNGVGMTDLNNLITLAGGAYLTKAVDLNDRGQVLALGSDGHSYLLSPVPEPSTWFMMSIGVLGVIGRTRAKSKVSAN